VLLAQIKTINTRLAALTQYIQKLWVRRLRSWYPKPCTASAGIQNSTEVVRKI